MSKMEEQLKGADFSSASEGLQERIWQQSLPPIDFRHFGRMHGTKPSARWRMP